MTNTTFNKTNPDVTNIGDLLRFTPCILHIEIQDLDQTQEKNKESFKNVSCKSKSKQNRRNSETNATNKKRNERVQFFTLISIIIIFIICNIPRITLLVHQVIIIDTIK